MQIVIKLPEEEYRTLSEMSEKEKVNELYYYERIIADGTPLPKGHGKLIDVGKIDEDRIDHDNPIIYLTVDGEYIEAVSLDYINNLPTIIEADK